MGLCSILALILVVIPLPLWITINYNFNYYQDVIRGFYEEIPQEVDFIVVGTGSAGAAVINRLSKHMSVLALEAGGDPLAVQSVPFYAPLLLHREETDWMHETVPQKFSSHVNPNSVVRWPRGKSLGGSSNLNYMIYVRAHPYDYDNWANLTGDSSWRYENLLPYFKKSYDYDGEFQHNTKHYSKAPNSYLHVSRSAYERLAEEWQQGMQELGYGKVDFNSEMRTGFGRMEFFKKGGKRWDSYTGFIKPILGRKNLHISRYSIATKIQFDKSNRAVGVWYVKNGIKKFVRARKEVILSAGSVESPKLLLLSGIGPQKDLHALKINPLVDLPVGKNLQDHVIIMLPTLVIEPPLSYSLERDFGFKEIYDYFVHGTGYLTSAGACHHHAFLSSSSVRKTGVDWPDLQLYFMSFSEYSTMASDFEKFYGPKKELMEQVLESVRGKNTFAITTALVRPKSVGYIKLKDKDPLTPPLIDPRYLEHPDDVARLIEGIQVSLNLIEKTKTFKNLNAYYPSTPYPNCKHLEHRSQAYWECLVRDGVVTLYHPVGTCKMGKASDPSAVVDSSLRVLGTKGLRVIDGSIMPVLVNGNTHAPITMIGEKGADIVREYWSQQYLVCLKPITYWPALEDRLSNNSCSYARLT